MAVLVDLLAEADAGIEAVGDDVPQSGGDIELDVDIGVVAQHGGELGQQGGAQHVVAAGDADGAGRLVAQFAQCVQKRGRVHFLMERC